MFRLIGTANGAIRQAQFLIIGAGAVGLQAIATAKHLGGVVKALDIRGNACIEAKRIGAEVIELLRPAGIYNRERRSRKAVGR